MRERKHSRGIMMRVVLSMMALAFVFCSASCTLSKDLVDTFVPTASPAGDNTPKPTGVIGVDVEKPEGYMPIDDYSYDIVGDRVVLNKYEGRDMVLTILAEYDVDGTVYTTDLTELRIGSDKVKTLIISEGITQFRHSMFDGTDIEQVYFPKSMTLVYDAALAYLRPRENELIKIYYGGTREEWGKIFQIFVSKDIAETEFGEEMGQALIDKLNELIGMEYDSSRYEYFFSASPLDME